jgi:hypothetical protein
MGGLTLKFHRRRANLLAGVPVFSVMRNETYFLPHFLRHYRALGAQSFVIYADRCDEAFMSALEAQEDVSILLSNNAKFGDVLGVQKTGVPKRLPTLLREYATNQMFSGRWHAVVDSDEFIVLPPPFSRLDDYTAFLDRAGMDHGFASMVDFYPRRLRERNFDPGIDPFQACPFFDEGPYHALDDASGRILQQKFGIRGRLLRFLLGSFPGEMKAMEVGPGHYAGALDYKFPIMKSSSTRRRLADHSISGVPSIRNACTIAHFKFYPELDAKVRTALTEGQYYMGSVEYRMLDFALRRLSDADLVTAVSRRYASPADLVAAGFMGTAGA